MSTFYIGLTATIIGMGIVFLVLALLAIVLSLFKFLNPPEPKKEDVIERAAEAIEVAEFEDTEIYEEAFDASNDDMELVAVISAAISAYLGGSNFAVKSIMPVRTVSAWNTAAKRENHRGLY